MICLMCTNTYCVYIGKIFKIEVRGFVLFSFSGFPWALQDTVIER